MIHLKTVGRKFAVDNHPSQTVGDIPYGANADLKISALIYDRCGPGIRLAATVDAPHDDARHRVVIEQISDFVVGGESP